MKLALTLLIALSCLFARAQAEPAASQLAARQYALYDPLSRQMLLEQHAHERVAPGSLAKLMTAWVAFGALRDGTISLQQKIAPTQYALRLQSKEPRMFLQSGQAVSVDDLLGGLIVQSANDAARVLAEAVAHHELAFVDRMNAEAKKLGLHDTHFANASGVDEAGQYSSAHDLILLAAALQREFPEFMPRYAERRFSYNGIEQYSHNRLLWLDPRVDGQQTAYLDGVGYALLASAQSGRRRLLSLVLGTPTEALRNSESQRLLNHGFREYESVLLYRKQQPVQTMHVWKGTQDSLDIGFAGDLHVTIPLGAGTRLKATIETVEPLVAPVDAGRQVGILHLALDGKPLLDAPVVALRSVPLANVFARGVDAIRLWLRQGGKR